VCSSDLSRSLARVEAESSKQGGCYEAETAIASTNLEA